MCKEAWVDEKQTYLNFSLSPCKHFKKTVLTTFSHRNKGFINYFILQKLGCQKP